MAARPPVPPPTPSETHRKETDSVSRPGDEEETRRRASRQEGARDAPVGDNSSTSSRAFNRNAWVAAHRGAYAGFGAMAMALDLIPGAAVVCMFGNTVGAALWASRIEKGATVEGMAGVKGRKEL